MAQRAKAALNAMRAIGIDPQLTESVLKSLLRTFDNNWEHIEAENYRLLADSIFESQTSLDEDFKRKRDDDDEASQNGETDWDVTVRSSGKEPKKEAVSKATEVAKVQDDSSKDIQVASSPMGNVSLSLHCNSAVLNCPGFRGPNIEDVCKLVEKRHLAAVKTIHPDFSLMNILKEICGCFFELGSKSARTEKKELLVKKGSKQNAAPKRVNGSSMMQRVEGEDGSGRSQKKMKSKVPEPSNAGSQSLALVEQPEVVLDIVRPVVKFESVTNGREALPTSSQSLVLVRQPQIVTEDKKRLANPKDVSNGQERNKIPVFNDINDELPLFNYIRHNIIYQKASVPFSLARIGDEYCCPDCYGDCLRAQIPCACARETGGEFAYKPDGLLKDEFLNSYISKHQNPQIHHLHYCQNCPVERIKNEAKPERCKGHLVRTFIKECWNKCGCHRQCGNRVVQRGIRCQMEVFYTGKAKGWGLRTTEALPRGTFVCEYVGEILTNMELYDRTISGSRNKRHTYPVMLDADWASEGLLEDEESLCLDATNYGNVARFINHRCYDSNLIEIPVEIETPDHHYYHVAFFTTRPVKAFEELCWDYNIDFDDHDHPVEAFSCLCGSKLCRDRKRNKGRSTALAHSRKDKMQYT